MLEATEEPVDTEDIGLLVSVVRRRFWRCSGVVVASDGADSSSWSVRGLGWRYVEEEGGGGEVDGGGRCRRRLRDCSDRSLSLDRLSSDAEPPQRVLSVTNLSGDEGREGGMMGEQEREGGGGRRFREKGQRGGRRQGSRSIGRAAAA